MNRPTDQRPERMLTMASGGWVLVVTGLVCLGLIAWALAPAFLRLVDPPIGDGRDPASYGFDLSAATVPAERLVPALRHRDMVPVLDGPAITAGAGIAAVNEAMRGKYVVGADRVVGVIVGGEARAYPISVLNVHEIVNDTLGGRPVAVTYHWPCDSVRAVVRELDGEPVRFGVSGLVLNGNLLMYDRRGEPAGGGESLWCQLTARAIAGPAVGTALEIVPSEVTTWTDWLERHPDTSVILRDARYAKRYRHAVPAAYVTSADLMFPVDPPPPADGPPAKTRVVAVTAGGRRAVFPLPAILRLAGDGGEWRHELGDTTLVFRPRGEPPVVRVTAEPPTADLEVAHAFWFAWHAMHPDDDLAVE
jgi:hypothetical protein